ncbi:hypothetical protein G7Y79_00021g050790 [Physcia stellaris]|nr:hypothetical protein G7Y79_00021g050790 [Physcia stellaris]
MPGYAGQLEPLSYARLFTVVMIHAHVIAEITKCNNSEMSGFYTHVSLEFFEQTAKLIQKIKKLRVDEKDRATLRDNLSTIYALTELNFRLRGLYCREPYGRYEERKLENFDQLDSVQKHGHGKSLSQWAEAERSSILHDQRWAHLKSKQEEDTRLGSASLQLRDIEPEHGHAEREPDSEEEPQVFEVSDVLENAEMPGAESHEAEELPGEEMTSGYFGVVSL